MTPREKAEELVNKMFGIQIDNQTFHMYNTLETAKYSALIAVDEIMEEAHTNFKYEYWQQVKQEIEKL
jgi:hypothetical protein